MELLAVPAPQALPLLAALGDKGALNSWVSRLGSVKTLFSNREARQDKLLQIR
jgi:hypothetical protein